MIYNYKKAGKLFDNLWDIISDVYFSFEPDTKQKERRLFMRRITHGENMTIYIDLITSFIKELASEPEKKELGKIALLIVLFTN